MREMAVTDISATSRTVRLRDRKTEWSKSPNQTVQFPQKQ
jgi:hypothetical protein